MSAKWQPKERKNGRKNVYRQHFQHSDFPINYKQCFEFAVCSVWLPGPESISHSLHLRFHFRLDDDADADALWF